MRGSSGAGLLPRRGDVDGNRDAIVAKKSGGLATEFGSQPAAFTLL